LPLLYRTLTLTPNRRLTENVINRISTNSNPNLKANPSANSNPKPNPNSKSNP